MMSDIVSIIDFSFKNPSVFVLLIIILIMIFIVVGVYDKKFNKQKELEQKIEEKEKFLLSKIENNEKLILRTDRKVEDKIKNDDEKYDHIIQMITEIKNSVDSIREVFFDFVEESSLDKEKSSKLIRKLNS